jgi:UDP-2,4-diacetamido-2,4,6-trideoxy-beta-L-altropyranose hydrolase
MDTVKIAIRTDASIHIGSGHVMRCLTLADALRKEGADVLFICRELHGNLFSLIESLGYSVMRLSRDSLPGPYDGAPWDGSDKKIDAVSTKDILKNHGTEFDWLVVDHYDIDESWEKIVRDSVGKIMVIDDLANRSHDCDLLLDQNYYHSSGIRYNGLVPSHCLLLLGPKYALLRGEFRDIESRPVKNGILNRILIFFGGVDLSNETLKAMEAVKGLNIEGLWVDVVVGRTNPHRAVIESRCEIWSGFHYHCQINYISELMSKADLSIGAGGSTTLERIYLGLPSIVLSVAENQEASMKDLSDDQYILYAGKNTDVDGDTLKIVLESLNRYELINMATRCREMVDGRGVERVVEKMCEMMLRG